MFDTTNMRNAAKEPSMSIRVTIKNPDRPEGPKRAQDSGTFGQMVRKERIALGKTQDDLAHAVGTRRQTIADLERGKNVGSHIVFATLGALGKLVEITDARPDTESMRKMLVGLDNG